MSLWHSYRILSTRTRLLIGGSVMAYAGFGIFASDLMESYFGLTPTDQDRQRLKEAMPKIHTIDREK
ncbi:hypothetical protein LTR08_004857 [Meristemomyces frigidus]|nr:hypothetical protein LTR08_004857 [Meristemomyces frigidus]